MKLSRLLPIAFIIATLSFGTACAGYMLIDPDVNAVWVASSPPATVREIITEPPGTDFVWIQGYYIWTGIDYRWIAGRWERRPFADAVYVPGKWYHNHDHGWYFVKGRWARR